MRNVSEKCDALIEVRTTTSIIFKTNILSCLFLSCIDLFTYMFLLSIYGQTERSLEIATMAALKEAQETQNLLNKGGKSDKERKALNYRILCLQKSATRFKSRIGVVR